MTPKMFQYNLVKGPGNTENILCCLKGMTINSNCNFSIINDGCG
jgi:hypothetical protein